MHLVGTSVLEILTFLVQLVITEGCGIWVGASVGFTDPVSVGEATDREI